MNWDNLVKIMQLTGAALAIPAGAAGVYSAYRSYFSADVACQNLRGTIVATMEKNIAADAKRVLLRKDIATFEKDCAAIDPDAKAIFQAALQELERPSAAAGPGAGTGPQRPAFPGLANLLAGAQGARGGWVTLGRADAGELNFEGYAVSAKSLPPAGTVLTARWPVPVWAEPQGGARPDLTSARALLRAGMCVRVLSSKAAGERLWAEVRVTACS